MLVRGMPSWMPRTSQRFQVSGLLGTAPLSSVLDPEPGADGPPGELELELEPELEAGPNPARVWSE